MLCPYCHEAMKQGYICGDRYALKWIDGSKYKFLYSHFQKGLKLTKGLMGVNDLETFYCEDCKKMIINVPDKVE